MVAYASWPLGITMQFPDDWQVQSGKDREIEKFARRCKAGEDPGTSIFAVYDRQNASGDVGMNNDGAIEMQVCHDNFVNTVDPKRLTKQDVNGIESFHFDSVNARPPESVFLHFVCWRAAPGMSVYVSMHAIGRERLNYVLSVFETLCPIDSSPKRDRKPLFECEPWCVPPSIYRMTKRIDDNNRSLWDLTMKPGLSEKALYTDKRILSGEAAVGKWKEMKMGRKRRVPDQDCYFGPRDLFSLGVFSEQVIDLLRTDFEAYFTELPCRVNDEPYYCLAPKPVDSCLDINNCQIKRFDDGGIMSITRYRFHKERVPDPLIFAVLEDRTAIFATASIRDKVEKAGLIGIAFLPVDGNGREFTFADNLADGRKTRASKKSTVKQKKE